MNENEAKFLSEFLRLIGTYNVKFMNSENGGIDICVGDQKTCTIREAEDDGTSSINIYISAV